MLFMNTYEIDEAVAHASKPLTVRATTILRDLRDLADDVSDGWCYWRKPCRAAKKLQELILATRPGPAPAYGQEITTAKLKAALVPIKAFLTREAKNLQGRTINLDI